MTDDQQSLVRVEVTADHYGDIIARMTVPKGDGKDIVWNTSSLEALDRAAAEFSNAARMIRNHEAVALAAGARNARIKVAAAEMALSRAQAELAELEDARAEAAAQGAQVIGPGSVARLRDLVHHLVISGEEGEAWSLNADRHAEEGVMKGTLVAPSTASYNQRARVRAALAGLVGGWRGGIVGTRAPMAFQYDLPGPCGAAARRRAPRGTTPTRTNTTSDTTAPTTVRSRARTGRRRGCSARRHATATSSTAARRATSRIGLPATRCPSSSSRPPSPTSRGVGGSRGGRLTSPSARRASDSGARRAT